jgi:hypothetical protein
MIAALRPHLPRTLLGWLVYAAGVFGCGFALGLIIAFVHVLGLIRHPHLIAETFIFGAL